MGGIEGLQDRQALCKRLDELRGSFSPLTRAGHRLNQSARYPPSLRRQNEVELEFGVGLLLQIEARKFFLLHRLELGDE